MNFQTFDLNLLRVFDALMRERSVTRAGERVGLSQPAVSAALARLRAALDDQLFVRRGADMIPTPRAETLAPPIREALASMEKSLFGDRRFDPATAQTTFTLLGGDFFSQLVLPRLAARFRSEAPGVRIRMIDSARGDINRLLQEDAVDLVLEAPQTPSDPGVSSTLLFVSTFVVVAARGHPKLAGVAPGEPIPLDLFCTIPQALRSITGDMSGVIDEALAPLDARRDVVLAVPHFLGVALAVARSDLIAALPAKFANAVADDLGLALYQTPTPSPASEIRMFWHSRHDKNPAHQWMRGELLEAVKGL